MAKAIRKSGTTSKPKATRKSGATGKSEALALLKHIDYDPFAEALAANKKIPAIQIPASFWGTMQPILEKIKYKPSDPLPKADVLVITWTTAETQALSAVMTSNHDYKTTWFKYQHKSAPILKKVPQYVITQEKNTLKLGAIGWLTMVMFNGKKVLLFKSELHPAVDGVQLPVVDLVQQIAQEAQPSLIITTGTAGAIGSDLKAGDAVVTGKARFFLVRPKTYADFPGITDAVQFASTIGTVKKTYITKCNSQVTVLAEPAVNEICLAKGYPQLKRTPVIYYDSVPGLPAADAVSSNGFSMDDAAHKMGLQDLGAFNEMNDAFVVFALSQVNATKNIPWLSIRNMSEPQAPDLSTATKKKWHQMYDDIGFYTTYNSAFACWAVICGI